MEFPSDTTVRWLVHRTAALLTRQQDPNVKRPVVLPNGEFFPDDFDGDAGSVNLLFWRLQEHGKLTDLDVELRFIDDGGAASGAGCCSAGSCGTQDNAVAPAPLPPVVRLSDAYRVDVLLSQARKPETLTAYLATALARIHIEETGGFDESWPENEWRSTCELAAITLGFGVLLANASYMFSKGCGGVHVDRATALQVTEIALGLAIFVAHHEITSSFTNTLDPTQRAAMSEAKLWVDSNQKLIRRLRRDPAEVARDEMLEVQEAKPWLARVLGLGGKKKRNLEVFDEDGFSQFEAEMKRRKTQSADSKKTDGSIDDLRALVDESLEEVRASREQV